MYWKDKYLKYKSKYLELKKLIGGAPCLVCKKEPCECLSTHVVEESVPVVASSAALVQAVVPVRAAWLNQSPPESFFTLDDIERRAKEDDPVETEFEDLDQKWTDNNPDFKQLIYVPITPEQEAARAPKNRYVNILPQTATRVVLKTYPQLGPESDYINADHVNLPNEPHGYILTQAPKAETINDFWRMVWEQQASIIVMLTDFVENGRRKAVQYWPDVEAVYGMLKVKLKIKEPVLDTGIEMRVFDVSHIVDGGFIECTHFHYKTWPDHHALSEKDDMKKYVELLHQYRRMRNSQPVGHKSIIHCSAGVGRSGTFLASDYLLRDIERQTAKAIAEKGKTSTPLSADTWPSMVRISVHNVVRQLRLARGGQVVQTPEQYRFIFQFLDHCLEENVLLDIHLPAAKVEPMSGVTATTLSKEKL